MPALCPAKSQAVKFQRRGGGMSALCRATCRAVNQGIGTMPNKANGYWRNQLMANDLSHRRGEIDRKSNPILINFEALARGNLARPRNRGSPEWQRRSV